MGTTRTGARLRRAASHLPAPPFLPQSRLQLPERVDHRVACGLAGHGDQLTVHDHLCGRVLEPVLPAQVQVRVVPEVQLHPLRRSGRGHPGRGFHSVVCLLRCQW